LTGTQLANVEIENKPDNMVVYISGYIYLSNSCWPITISCIPNVLPISLMYVVVYTNYCKNEQSILTSWIFRVASIALDVCTISGNSLPWLVKPTSSNSVHKRACCSTYSQKMHRNVTQFTVLLILSRILDTGMLEKGLFLIGLFDTGPTSE
jgi:hypothetical protein